jgi:hypothetical protein
MYVRVCLYSNVRVFVCVCISVTHVIAAAASRERLNTIKPLCEHTYINSPATEVVTTIITAVATALILVVVGES